MFYDFVKVENLRQSFRLTLFCDIQQNFHDLRTVQSSRYAEYLSLFQKSLQDKMKIYNSENFPDFDEYK